MRPQFTSWVGLFAKSAPYALRAFHCSKSNCRFGRFEVICTFRYGLLLSFFLARRGWLRSRERRRLHVGRHRAQLISHYREITSTPGREINRDYCTLDTLAGACVSSKQILNESLRNVTPRSGLIGGEPTHLRQMSKPTAKLTGPLSLRYFVRLIPDFSKSIRNGHLAAFSLIRNNRQVFA